MQHLPDGSYQMIAIDTPTFDEGNSRVEITITLGPHIGEVHALRARRIHDPRAASGGEDPRNLLGAWVRCASARGIRVFRPEWTRLVAPLTAPGFARQIRRTAT
ncbi:MAG: hypothetical protein ABSH04_03140 [Acidimicrobiales bacterium]|jgi:hypothetical protein